LQTHELREFAEHRGWTIAGKYVDVGVSGNKESRPAWNELLDAVRQRKCDVVLVWNWIVGLAPYGT
jgi:DNA invertase Pin-like site-specific DNA recombinase